MVTVTDAQEETAARFRQGYGVGVTRWMVPPLRLEDEGNAAFRTVGALELHLFLGKRDGKADWHKLVIRENGFAEQAHHHTPEHPPYRPRLAVA